MTKRAIVFGIVLCALVIGVSYGLTTKAKDPKSDIFLIRTDLNGQLLWSRRYSFGYQTQCTAVTALRNAGFAFAARADSCLNESIYNRGVWLLFTDKTGTPCLDRCYPGETMNGCVGMMQLENGQIILAGDAHGGGACLMSINEDGETLWKRTYGSGHCNAFALTSDGGFVLVGTITLTYGPQDGLIIKTDSTGEPQWFRVLGGPNLDFLYDVTMSSDGRIFAVGESEMDSLQYYPALRSDGWVVIADSLGNILQDRCYGQNVDLSFHNIQRAPDYGFLMLGYQLVVSESGDIRHVQVITKIDQNGDSLWSRPNIAGWDKVEPIKTDHESECSILDYLNRATYVETAEFYIQLSARAKLQPAIDQLQNADSIGFIQQNGRIGMLSDGYYFVADYRHRTPPDSAWNKKFPNLH
jgi:hypothetical protein